MSEDREARVALVLVNNAYRQGWADAERTTREKSRGIASGMRQAKDATTALGEAQRLGAERITKYGTAIGQATGSIRALGIQNEVLAKGISVTSDLFLGMAGPIGIAVIAIGAATAAIASIIQKHKEWDASVKTSSQTLLDFAKQHGVHGDIASMIVRDEINKLGAEKKQIEAELARLRREADDAIFGRTAAPWQLGTRTAIPMDAYPAVRALKEQGAVLQARLNELNKSLYELWVASEGGPAGKSSSAKDGGGLPGMLKLTTAEEKLDHIIGKIRNDLDRVGSVSYADFLLDKPGEIIPDVQPQAWKTAEIITRLRDVQVRAMDDMRAAAFDAAMGSTAAWTNFAQATIRNIADVVSAQAAAQLKTLAGGGLFGGILGAIGGSVVAGLFGLIAGAATSGEDPGRSARESARQQYASSGSSGGNLRGAAEANRPLTVQYFVQTTVNGPVVGPQGMDELVDQYIIPRLVPATALGQTG